LNYRNTKCKEEKKSENDCPCSLKEELRYHGSLAFHGQTSIPVHKTEEIISDVIQ